MAGFSDFHLQALGQRLRALRHNRGLTQLALAERAGVTRLRLIAIEAGNGSVAMAGYARVAAALGTQLDLAPLQRPTLEELGKVFGG